MACLGSLFIRKSLDKAPPYSWPVRADATPEIYEPSQLASVNRLLHRRYQGESQRLDVMATVAASIASLGFPTFRYRRDSQLPEYLFLIDRAGFRDHQSHLYEHLATMLRAQGLYVTTWFFDGDPRVCWSADRDGSVYLEQLARTCPGHRLLLFGTAKYLLDAVSGRLAEWYRIFEGWTERAILTPEPPSRCSARELALATEFVVVPASLDGLSALAAYFDLSGPRGQDSADDRGGANPAPGATGEISAVRSYLGADLFQWLCACAIYPELQWGLTLTLGALPSMPPGLVCEENLTKLLRLEWFRTGSIPDDRRRELIAELDPRVERDVREAIVRVLQDSGVPEETIAASAHNFQIACQRARLAPKDRKARANLKTALEDLSTHEIVREHAYLDVSESVSRSPLHLVLPQSLRKAFYPAAVPWMTMRLSSSLAMVLLVVVVGLGGLRVADRIVLSGTGNQAAPESVAGAPAPPIDATMPSAVPVVALTIVPPTGGTIIGDGITCGTMGTECETQHPQGKLITLKPLADAEYTFKGFTGECAQTGETTMNKPRRCGALFVRDRFAGNSASGAAGTGAKDSIFSRDASHPPAAESGKDGKDVKEAPAPLSPEGIAKDDIQKLLEAYRKAWEARDVERIKGVYPTAPVKNLSYFFYQVKSVEYKYTTPPEFVDLNTALGSATVKINALVTTENKGPRSEPVKLKNLFTLKRQQGAWSIAQLDVSPDK